MKYLYFILLLIFLTTSCTHKLNYLNSFNLKGNVRVIYQETHRLKSKIEENKLNNKTLKRYEIMVFNKNNDLVKQTEISDKQIMKKVYKQTYKGKKMTTRNVYNGENKLIEEYQRKRKSKGLMEETRINENQEPELVKRFYYKKGMLSSDNFYAQGKLQRRTEYEYADRLPKTTTVYKQPDRIWLKSKYEYNENNDITKSLTDNYYSDGIRTVETNTSYTYDQKGNWIKKIEKSDMTNNYGEVVIRNIVYKEDVDRNLDAEELIGVWYFVGNKTWFEFKPDNTWLIKSDRTGLIKNKNKVELTGSWEIAHDGLTILMSSLIEGGKVRITLHGYSTQENKLNVFMWGLNELNKSK